MPLQWITAIEVTACGCLPHFIHHSCSDPSKIPLTVIVSTQSIACFRCAPGTLICQCYWCTQLRSKGTSGSKSIESESSLPSVSQEWSELLEAARALLAAARAICARLPNRSTATIHSVTIHLYIPTTSLLLATISAPTRRPLAWLRARRRACQRCWRRVWCSY